MSSNDAAIMAEFYEDKFKYLGEVLNLILKNTNEIPEIKSDIKQLKDDIRIVKLAVRDTNTDLKLLERRVTKLETA